MKNSGVGYGKISSRAQPVVEEGLADVRAQIATGKIKVTAATPPPANGLRNRVYRKGRVSSPPLPV